MKMYKLAAAAAVLCASGLGGCATVFEGTSQNPQGASCVFERLDDQVEAIASTPGTANIQKSKHDITVKCDKPGYQEAQYRNHSGTTATIAANVAADILLTGGLSSIIDSADGAANKYDSAVNLTLIPLDMVPASAPAPASNPASSQVPAQKQ